MNMIEPACIAQSAHTYQVVQSPQYLKATHTHSFSSLLYVVCGVYRPNSKGYRGLLAEQEDSGGISECGLEGVIVDFEKSSRNVSEYEVAKTRDNYDYKHVTILQINHSDYHVST